MTLLRHTLSLILAAGVIGPATAAEPKDLQRELPKAPEQGPRFSPPDPATIPDNKMGEMIRRGRDIFVNTQAHAKDYVGNGLNCVNCHVNDGRQAGSAPLWGAMGMYPAYRGKNDMVNTIQHRIQGCFKYSMDGTPPPANGEVLTALVAYGHWMAKGAPQGEALPGRGYPDVDKPAKQPDFDRGRQVFADNCALCHGADGHGTRVDGEYVFPPLWGPDSFNWGAGMHRINTAAEFIQANMPYGKGGSLSTQQAWDVALFINSHERPRDPRYSGDFQELVQTYHQHQCQYGKTVDGKHLTGIVE